jgi:hypothetical protein
MKFEGKKLELINWIMRVENPGILNALVELRDSYPAGDLDWFDLLTDEEKIRLKQSDMDFRAGRTIPNDEVLKKFERGK